MEKIGSHHVTRLLLPHLYTSSSTIHSFNIFICCINYVLLFFANVIEDIKKMSYLSTIDQIDFDNLEHSLTIKIRIFELLRVLVISSSRNLQSHIPSSRVKILR